MADVFTWAGVAWATDLLDVPTMYIACGTGTNTADREDTTLGAETTESRVSASASRSTTAKTNDTISWSATWECNATGKTVSECGLFTASSGGSLVLHSNFSGRAVVQYDELDIVMKLVFD